MELRQRVERIPRKKDKPTVVIIGAGTAHTLPIYFMQAAFYV